MASALKYEFERTTPSARETANIPDNLLLPLYLNGQEEAFNEIVCRYRNSIINFIYRLIGDRDRAEDLSQEVFMRLHKHAERYDPNKKLSSWIFTIAANLAKNELRNRARNIFISFQTLNERVDGDGKELVVQFRDTKNDPDVLYHKRSLEEVVRVAVTKLSDKHREVFILREIEDKDYDEIAEIAGIGVGTVKSRLNRARTAFAKHVEPHIN